MVLSLPWLHIIRFFLLQFLVNDMDNQYLELQCIDAADTAAIGSLGT